MEAYLRWLRDEGNPRYQEITHHAPVPFDDPYTARDDDDEDYGRYDDDYEIYDEEDD